MNNEKLSIQEMEKYIEWLKNLPQDEAYKISKKNLIESGIIDENCEFTEYYSHLNDYFKSI